LSDPDTRRRETEKALVRNKEIPSIDDCGEFLDYNGATGNSTGSV
jgi:hypothetical protein